MAFVLSQMTVGQTRDVREPWAGFFHALAREPEYQEIQVARAREGLQRAVYWCDYFNFRSERGLVFFADTVASHGGGWLTRKGANRKALLREAMSKKKAALGRELTEVELMLEIADVLGKTVRPKYARNVRMRKRAIALGGVYKCISVPGLGITDQLFTTNITDRPLAAALSKIVPRPAATPPPPDPPYPPGWRCRRVSK